MHYDDQRSNLMKNTTWMGKKGGGKLQSLNLLIVFKILEWLTPSCIASMMWYILNSFRKMCNAC